MTELPLYSLALLIDADNLQPIHIDTLLKFTEYHGHLSIARAYGDWKQPNLSAWDKKAPSTIERVQVNRVAKKKNVTDHYMMVDAGRLSARIADDDMANDDYGISKFIIASGDGDFISAIRALKDRNCKVICVGNKKQLFQALKEDCKVYYLEDLPKELADLQQSRAFTYRDAQDLHNALHQTYVKFALEANDRHIWVSYAQLGKKLRELFPDFQSQFGNYKLSELLAYFDWYECDDQMQRVRITW
jgi:hypothetical protein